jgi:hypothetical protein
MLATEGINKTLKIEKATTSIAFTFLAGLNEHETFQI